MSIELNISSDPDELTLDTAVLYYKDITDGYIHALNNLVLKREYSKDFFNDLLKEFNDVTIIDLSKNRAQINKRYKHQDFRLYVNGDSKNDFINIYTKDDKISLKIWEIFKKYDVDSEEISIFLTSYYMSKDMVNENTKILKLEDLKDISELYYPYINTSLMFEQFFTGGENILLCVGNPGVGKSKFASYALKFALNNPDKLPYEKKKTDFEGDEFIEVAFVKSVDVLTSDDFWNSLEEKKYDFVLMDDLDFMLTKRSTEVQTADDMKKNSFLNQFLSFTDGVEKYNTKFIITTNQIYDDIDTAILRKGRLFDILELRILTNDEALKIWNSYELNEKIFHELFSGDVIPANLGSEISKRMNTRIQDATKSYLYEPEISKIAISSTKKKIKF